MTITHSGRVTKLSTKLQEACDRLHELNGDWAPDDQDAIDRWGLARLYLMAAIEQDARGNTQMAMDFVGQAMAKLEGN